MVGEAGLAQYVRDNLRPGDRTYFFLTDDEDGIDDRGNLTQAGVEAAAALSLAVGDLSRALRKLGVTDLSACCRPGDYVSDDALAYESTIRVTEGHLHLVSAATLDTRVASVSVHFWPGSPLLALIDATLAAPRGLFLVLGDEDIGEAKVYLQNMPTARWSIVRDHPLNELEQAEYIEMVNGFPKGPRT